MSRMWLANWQAQETSILFEQNPQKVVIDARLIGALPVSCTSTKENLRFDWKIMKVKGFGNGRKNNFTMKERVIEK